MTEYLWHTDLRYFDVAELYEAIAQGETVPLNRAVLRKAELMALEHSPEFTLIATRTRIKNLALMARYLQQ